MKSRMAMLLGILLLVVHLAACGGGGGGGDDDGGGGGDFIFPTVIATAPAHNGTEVETNRAITATFSEAIDPGTINASSFKVVDNATKEPVTGNVGYDGPSRTAVFRPTPTDPLSPQTTYVATITTAVEDLAGNPLDAPYTWQFTTGGAPALDTTPPSILRRFPTPNAIGVATNAVIAVTFSEPLDPSTINAQSLTLSKDGIPVTGTVTYVGATALFTPATNLIAGAGYTVLVAATITDLAGNALAAASSWNFTAGSQADVTGPQVLSVSPPEGTVAVPTDASLVVTFDEAIKPFEFGLIDGRPVAVTFNDTYTIVTMTPTAGLRPGVTYNASISVSDLAGNPMAAAYVWKFSTQP